MNKIAKLYNQSANIFPVQMIIIAWNAFPFDFQGICLIKWAAL